jgi:aryl-alcohol dehydrogenase-like predicted oxidoreductase
MRSKADSPNGNASDRLIVGGHSFISQLGNDPAASEREQLAIVESCLNSGIRSFDTTYQPERAALGKALNTLGRRSEAKIFAWNFFTDFGPDEPVGQADICQPHHINIILNQLRTDYVDCLVVVPAREHEQNRRQAELATEWRRKGYVHSLGLWVEDLSLVSQYHGPDPFCVAVRPFNVTTGDDAIDVFADYNERGWTTLATSPFFRGWELDRIIAAASARQSYDADTLRKTLADLMLRYSLFQSHADRVVVSMRKTEWIRRNLESTARGPLIESERRLLRRLQRLAEKPWWQRLRLPRPKKTH